MKDSNYNPVSDEQFVNIYRASFGPESYLDIDLMISECSGVRSVSGHSCTQLELTPHYILGNEIVEVIQRKGGVVQLDSFLGAYKSLTNKNLDPTVHGYNSVENLILSYSDLLLAVHGRTIMLKDVEHQISNKTQMPYLQPKPDVVAQTPDEELYQLATRDSVSSIVSPALRSVRQETMFKTSKLKLTGCLASSNPANTLDQTPVRRVQLSPEDQEDVIEEEANDNMVMYSTSNTRNIVTVETDTSDAESMVSMNNTRATQVSSSRGRKKSRLAAFPFLE